ncbi:hypothetical protein ACHAXM_007368 [Skeletonema potamos]
MCFLHNHRSTTISLYAGYELRSSRPLQNQSILSLLFDPPWSKTMLAIEIEILVHKFVDISIYILTQFKDRTYRSTGNQTHL